MRKNLLLLTIVLLSGFVVRAQITKGSIFLGGEISYSKQRYESGATPTYISKSRSFSISPAVGKAVRDNLVTGVDLLYHSYKSDNSKNENYGTAVFVRRYFPVIGNLYIFGQARVGAAYTTGLSTSSSGDLKAKGLALGLNLYPGISYAVKNNLHLEAAFTNLVYIQYSYQESRQENIPGKNITSAYSVGSNISNGNYFTLGLRFFIPRNT